MRGNAQGLLHREIVQILHGEIARTVGAERCHKRTQRDFGEMLENSSSGRPARYPRHPPNLKVNLEMLPAQDLQQAEVRHAQLTSGGSFAQRPALSDAPSGFFDVEDGPEGAWEAAAFFFPRFFAGSGIVAAYTGVPFCSPLPLLLRDGVSELPDTSALATTLLRDRRFL